ncbi:MAG TPA: heavy metal translocating P-type ATPase [Gammaproteobacteria bacterium]|nr:heavy metal translocating P-type ATPase [Gammaproteobacteria bacterium]
MLLVNIGIMASLYIGARLFEHHSDKKSLTHKIRRDALPCVSIEPCVSTDNIKENTEQGIEKEAHDHHFKVSGAAMGLSVISYIYPPLRLFNLGVIAYTTFPILKQAEKSLLEERRIKNDLLTSLVSIMSIAMGQYFAAALQAWVYHFGCKMINKSQDTSTQMLTNVFEQQPSKVWLLKDRQEIETPLESLNIDDIVVVKAGDIVPIDGTISEGMAMIDQHALTGEAMPAEKSIGDLVFAATIVVSGCIYIKVEKTGVETTVAKLGEILSHTADFKTSLQLKGEKWSDKVAMPLISLSVLASPLLGASSATAILYSAPTNTVRVMTSLQTFNHLSLVLNKGILIKDGRALEELTQIDTVLFDKTGTLTTGEPEVGEIIRCDNIEEDEILSYAAAAEQRLTHPIARAIVKKAEERHLNLPDISDANYKIGYGVTVSFNNLIIKVGSARFMTLEGIALSSRIDEAIRDSQEKGDSLVMVAINDELKGAIEMQSKVRPEVEQIITGLRQRGIQQIAIVSGDHKQPTQKLAETLGMDNYFYEVLPQDKASLVEQLQKAGHKVCFVGDGINDAIAMKKANVSISLRGASSIATDMAQVVLMDGTLSRLCDIFDISKQLNTNLEHSLLFWAGYGVFNITATSLLRFDILKSTLVLGTFFGLGIGHAMLPLRQLEQEKGKSD